MTNRFQFSAVPSTPPNWMAEKNSMVSSGWINLLRPWNCVTHRRRNSKASAPTRTTSQGNSVDEAFLTIGGAPRNRLPGSWPCFLPGKRRQLSLDVVDRAEYLVREAKEVRNQSPALRQPAPDEARRSPWFGRVFGRFAAGVGAAGSFPGPQPYSLD